jgi:hypothetical protein
LPPPRPECYAIYSPLTMAGKALIFATVTL